MTDPSTATVRQQWFKTALILRDEGWEPQGVYWVLEALDNKLGKFVGREDREDQIATIVEDYGVKH